jgi:LL-diaminopimelate aminotransferase
MDIKLAKRVAELPPYLFAEIDRAKSAERAKGVDVIDLGVGDPDMPTFGNIVAKLQEAAANPGYHKYPSYQGLAVFREAVANWYASRFNVQLDPATEVVNLIGSKEGISHISLAFTDPGDINLMPDPAYPVYNIGTLFAGGRSYFMPLLEKNGYLPDYELIPDDVAENSKLMFLNYPNNPTAALADHAFFDRTVAYAKKHNIIVCHDAAYTELYFGDNKPISFMEVDGAKDVGIEFHSLSKTYNMCGWRVAFCVGNKDVIAGLGKIKSNIDSGQFEALQIAGIEALEGDQTQLDGLRDIYRRRRDVLVEGLRSAGIKVSSPDASLYVWFPVPAGRSSAEFATDFLQKAGVVATPGTGFGDHGEGYVRMTLCLPEERLLEAVERMKTAGLV